MNVIIKVVLIISAVIWSVSVFLCYMISLFEGVFMISCIIGLPGSGKSTLLSYIAHRAALGKSVNFHGFHISTCNYARVYTNFPSKGCYKLDFDLLGKADYNNCLMLCDEIQLFADSRNFKDFSDDLKFWFSNHRKMRTDFCYATQSFDAVDKRIRSLTDRIYFVDKWFFGFIRCREILTVTNFRTLSQEFEPASGFNSAYFYAKRLYKFNDTYAIMQPRNFITVPLLSWDPVEPQKIAEQQQQQHTVIYKNDGSVELTKNTVDNC